jgi:hypothetical protein
MSAALTALAPAVVAVLTYLALALGVTYALYVFYAAVMNIARVRDAGKLTRIGYAFGYPTLIIGYTLDVICNWFVMTIVFAELPRETTVTARFKRHNRESTGWRKRVVQFFEPLLDPLDPSGDHI